MTFTVDAATILLNDQMQHLVWPHEGFNAIDVLANDSDPDGDVLTVLSFTQPANGVVTFSGVPGVLHYRANVGFCGLDTFTYTVSDGRGGTATATVTVNVLD